MALYIMCDIDGHVLSNPNNFYVCVHTLLNSFKMEAVMLSYRNHFYMDWFLYDNGLHHERVKKIKKNQSQFSGNVLVTIFNASF